MACKDEGSQNCFSKLFLKIVFVTLTASKSSETQAHAFKSCTFSSLNKSWPRVVSPIPAIPSIGIRAANDPNRA
jgi:hypothetical protein